MVMNFWILEHRRLINHWTLAFGDKPAPAMAQVMLRKTAEEGESVSSIS
jgi:hypothetical protein